MNNPIHLDRLRTKKEGAAYLHISMRHLDYLINARAIGVVRIGRSVRIDPTELLRLKNALTNGPILSD
jgi:excisionase family DNA binding protein